MEEIRLEVAQCPAIQVTLYRDSGTITRHFLIGAPEGNSQVSVSIRGISEHVDVSSIRFATPNDSPWAVVDVAVEDETYGEFDDAVLKVRFEEYAALVSELKELERESKLQNDNYKALKKRAAMLRQCMDAQLSAVPKGGLAKLSSCMEVSSVPKLINDFATASLEHAEQARAVKREQEVISGRTEVITARLSSMGRKPHDRPILQTGDAKEAIGQISDVSVVQQRTVVVKLEAVKGVKTTTDKVTINLIYQIKYQCRWTPSYDLFATSTASIGETKQVVDLEFFGRIEQETGEDWKDVEVRLSTANLDDLIEAPHFPAKFVRFPPPPAPPVEYGARDGRNYRFEAYAPLLCCSPEIATVATVENIGLSTEFVVPVRMTLPSEMGRSRRVTVAQLSLEAEVFRYTVPSLERSAYVQAMISNSSNVPLLACMGDVAAYLDGELVSHISIDRDVAPGDKFSASLGKDSSLRVDCSPLQEFQKEVGLISKTRSVAFEQTSTLRGEGVMKDTPIVVAAAVPVSKDAKIVVKLDDAPTCEVEESDDLRAAIAMLTSGKKSVLNKTTNHVLRLLVVPKGGQLQTKCAYAVEWPADKDLDRTEEVVA